MHTIFHSFILILAGILLLRIAGRKSISQMTLPQTIVMISIGTIIVTPIIEKSLTKTIVAASVFVLTLLVLEYLQVKSNTLEKFFTGKSKIVVEDGKLNVKNLKKLRLTVDQLEMRIRNEGIHKFDDIKFATIEPNGLLGFELAEDAKPLTIREFKTLMESYGFPLNKNSLSENTQRSASIFNEIKGKQKPENPELK
ncbi:DUF421 domain-containing protein [Gottfriedia acidiceleris]|uniref:DUF421 domain-containing protein n=1 Tax=Gottfriedia acidiceleris TaxID=371036 RepID=A0ABY4JRR8_9BACI|nr:YetF domain-containing protein [Gottfriedia acidiceleris]UPM56524.1 DUF421 domain-containing protein [Gottfriedia acidiceleris]